jgi:hypothetical protein
VNKGDGVRICDFTSRDSPRIAHNSNFWKQELRYAAKTFEHLKAEFCATCNKISANLKSSQMTVTWILLHVAEGCDVQQVCLRILILIETDASCNKSPRIEARKL